MKHRALRRIPRFCGTRYKYLPKEKEYTKGMQKIATKVFIYASVAFGIVGILAILTSSGPDKKDSVLSEILIKLLFVTVFVILPSFALSIAGKYLKDKP